MQRSIKLGHAALTTLSTCFQVQPPNAEDFGKQVPRADNSAADAAANWALDNRSFHEVRLQDGSLKALKPVNIHALPLLEEEGDIRR